jgi:Domain of unknown function (DUF6265)
MKRKNSLALAILFALLGVAPGISATTDLPQSFKIEELAWISGDWETVSGASQIEEHWTKVAGGTMIGMSRAMAGGKTVFFEYLRIETRGGDIYYVAHPKARNPGTEFKLVRLGPREAIFENLAHDFPKRIIYRKHVNGDLIARIEGDGTEKENPQEFHYRSVSR